MTGECQNIRTLLDRYLDQELDRRERELVEEHLESCLECRIEVSEGQAIIESLTSLPELSCPDSVTEGIESAVSPENTAADSRDRGRTPKNGWLTRENRPGRFRRLFGSPVWGSVAMAAAAIVVALLLHQGRLPNTLPVPKDPVDPAMIYSTQQADYSSEDVTEARRLARASLVYAARMLKEKEQEVLKDVLARDLPEWQKNVIMEVFSKRLSGPLRDSVRGSLADI